MIDCIFAVDSPVEWHRANIAANPTHYSFLRFAGPRAISTVQTQFGSRMYYNTAAPLPLAAGGAKGQLMKYGVVSTADLIEDLCDWRFLYAAGRMHKPIRVVASRPDIEGAAYQNHLAALTAVLLSLPATFSALDVYLRIAGLSYEGDFRMNFGENPDKVLNIVTGSSARFHQLYAPLLLKLRGSPVRQVAGTDLAALQDTDEGNPLATLEALRGCMFEQDTGLEVRRAAALALPQHVQRVGSGSFGHSTGSDEEASASWTRAVDQHLTAAGRGDAGPVLYRSLVGPSLARIVASSARTQSVKGNDNAV